MGRSLPARVIYSEFAFTTFMSIHFLAALLICNVELKLSSKDLSNSKE
jgi:hypothetical protein